MATPNYVARHGRAAAKEKFDAFAVSLVGITYL